MISLKEIVGSIFEKTQSGKLTWNHLGANVFQAIVGDNSVTIDRRRISPGGVTAPAPYELVFRDSEGNILETVDQSSAAYFEMNLEQLHELIRRQALHVEETLLDIKHTLDNL